MNVKYIGLTAVAALMMMSCGTGKVATTGDKTGHGQAIKEQNASLRFLQTVADNAIYQTNVVAKMTFTIDTGDKKISVPGSIHIRKDDVIRLQLFVPLLGSEVGRLEFTKDYVLIVDRLHKQYIKEDYNKVGFIRDKGLNFYTLQALFCNKLFIPGTQKVGESQLEEFKADLETSLSDAIVSLVQDKMDFKWTTDKVTGQINKADITYHSGSNGTSTLTWSYGDFRPFGSKAYPNTQVMTMKSDAIKAKREVKVTIEMSNVSADSNWESRTTVSDRYEKVGAESILKQLMKL